MTLHARPTHARLAHGRLAYVRLSTAGRLITLALPLLLACHSDKPEASPTRAAPASSAVDVRADLSLEKVSEPDLDNLELAKHPCPFSVEMEGTGAEYLGGRRAGLGEIQGLGRIDSRAHTSSVRQQARVRGKLKLGDGSTQGFCSVDDFTRQVYRRAGAIRACYERELQKKPKLAGKVSVKWTIASDGTVDDAEITRSTLKNKTAEKCILRVIRRIRFRKPKGGICIIKWPFIFNPG